MKKTLVALAVTAFATSASALTIYEQDGSKVTFDGSIRLRLDQHKENDDNQTTKRAHSNLHNDGSRFGIKVNHEINDDLFSFGRVEFRFNGGDRAKTTDQFGDIYAHRAYVGIGSKTYGELSFGRQVTIADDVHQAGFDNAYGVFDTAMTASGKAVVRYDYKGIKGLQLGVDYRFAEERDGKGEVVGDKLKSGYGAGAVYSFDVAEGQEMTLAAGYTRDNYKSVNSVKHHKDAWGFGVKYSIEQLTLGLDYTGAFDKTGSSKEVVNGFRVGAEYAVTPALKVYGNYGHLVTKEKDGSETVGKIKHHKFMLGTSYQIHKNVFTYVEGAIFKNKNDGNKSTSHDVGVGLRVFW